MPPATPPGDESLAAKASRLRDLAPDQFAREIDGLDDNTLADLRYEFRFDPTDPRNSEPQVRTINRLLVRRKERRATRRQWIGIALSGLIGLAGLIVAIVK